MMTSHEDFAGGRTIQAVLRFPGAQPSWVSRLTVQVLDVGRLDEDAEVVAETVLGECHVTDGTVVEVVLPSGGPGRHASWVLQVLADVSDSEDPAAGDYMTLHAPEVPPTGAGDVVEVLLSSV